MGLAAQGTFPVLTCTKTPFISESTFCENASDQKTGESCFVSFTVAVILIIPFPAANPLEIVALAANFLVFSFLFILP